MSLIARTGIQAPDSPNGTVFSKFLQFVLPDEGGVIILANLAGSGVTSANNEGVWAVDTIGQLRLIVRKGDFQTINGASKKISTLSLFVPTSTSPGQSRSFNHAGDLLYSAAFGGNASAIFRVVFP